MIPKKPPSWHKGKQIEVSTMDGLQKYIFDFDQWLMYKNIDGFVVFESFENGEMISISYDYILSVRVTEKKKGKLVSIEGGKDERSSA